MLHIILWLAVAAALAIDTLVLADMIIMLADMSTMMAVLPAMVHISTSLRPCEDAKIWHADLRTIFQRCC